VAKRTRGAFFKSLDRVLATRSDTEALGRAIGRALTGGEVLALIGELGAGKTTLVRGIAVGLDAPPASVSSPTFVLIHEYRGRFPLIHVDLYRLRTGIEAESIGLSDYFIDRAITAIEWADRFPTLLPTDRLEVRLTHRSPATRTAQLVAHGPQSHALLTRIRLARRHSRRSALSPDLKAGVRRKAMNR
jgi:tRNA threonylcarbamoyladenosine biosynthesis protein TsaE